MFFGGPIRPSRALEPHRVAIARSRRSRLLRTPLTRFATLQRARGDRQRQSSYQADQPALGEGGVIRSRAFLRRAERMRANSEALFVSLPWQGSTRFGAKRGSRGRTARRGCRSRGSDHGVAVLQLEFLACCSYFRGVSRLVDPNPPPDRPLAPTTSRWRRRHLGVVGAALVAITLGWGAWHYTHRVPTVSSNSVPLPAPGVR
jgi:hypothetical protein